MKSLSLGCLLALGLALAVGEVRADMRGGRGEGSPPQQGPAPSQHMESPGPGFSRPAPMVQTPRPAPVRTLPGVMERPAGGPVRPPGALRGPNATFAQPRQNFVGGQGNFRHFRHDGDFHRGDRDGDFQRGAFHRHGRRSGFILVYVNGLPCWYPFYTAYPYYYDVPLAPTYDSGYYDSGASYVPPVDESAGGGAVQTAPGYDELGHGWGQDLRRDVATWDQFVSYMQTYIIVATPAAQAEFREAFVASYGINGATAYDKAAEQAAPPRSQGPKIIDMHSAN